ncbi:hypothetical protein FHS86_001845 [Roseimarinus sediminis]
MLKMTLNKNSKTTLNNTSICERYAPFLFDRRYLSAFAFLPDIFEGRKIQKKKNIKQNYIVISPFKF